MRRLPRLYECEPGAVQISGVDVRDCPLDALLTRISIAVQEVFLFHGTVSDNLRLARPNAVKDAIVAVAQAARAHDFIQALTQAHAFITALLQGYDTILCNALVARAMFC